MREVKFDDQDVASVNGFTVVKGETDCPRCESNVQYYPESSSRAISSSASTVSGCSLSGGMTRNSRSLPARRIHD